MPRYDSYVICTSPRSGSTLLCKLLAATRVAGRPGSHFHGTDFSKWLAAYDITPEPNLSELDLLRLVFAKGIERGRNQSGPFALRMQSHSLRFFLEKLALLYPDLPSDVARIEAAFGKTLFVYLDRDNKIEQAVSWVKAQQTGLWHVAPDGTELERLSEPKDPNYNGTAIFEAYRQFEADKLLWEDWFQQQGIAPVALSYEELSAAPTQYLAVILGKLGLDPSIAKDIKPGVAKLADETNRDWVDHFQRDFTIART